MNRIRAIGRRIVLLAGLVTALVAGAGALPAFARQFPPGSAGQAPASTVPATAYAVGGGMPGWQIVLIAVMAALVAAVVAVLVDRAHAARRRVATLQGVAVPNK